MLSRLVFSGSSTRIGRRFVETSIVAADRFAAPFDSEGLGDKFSSTGAKTPYVRQGWRHVSNLYAPVSLGTDANRLSFLLLSFEGPRDFFLPTALISKRNVPVG